MAERTPHRIPLGGYGPAHLVVSGRRKNGRGDRPVMEKMAREGPTGGRCCGATKPLPPRLAVEAAKQACVLIVGGAGLRVGGGAHRR
jgi:hypothetical protein